MDPVGPVSILRGHNFTAKGIVVKAIGGEEARNQKGKGHGETNGRSFGTSLADAAEDGSFLHTYSFERLFRVQAGPKRIEGWINYLK